MLYMLALSRQGPSPVCKCRYILRSNWLFAVPLLLFCRLPVFSGTTVTEDSHDDDSDDEHDRPLFSRYIMFTHSYQSEQPLLVLTRSSSVETEKLVVLSSILTLFLLVQSWLLTFLLR